MPVKFVWMLKLLMPSGATWYFTEHKATGSLVKDPLMAVQFLSKFEAEDYLSLLKSITKGTSSEKIALALEVVQHGFE